jgi:ABC-type molybdate transport system substrate-binding protein|tara:strand:+ start:4999 stop:5136 length:138 start_codon:yes stop_codon:yes gene_type:complete
MIKIIFSVIPVLFVIGCASGHVNVSTQTPSDTDLTITIESKQSKD